MKCLKTELLTTSYIKIVKKLIQGNIWRNAKRLFLCQLSTVPRSRCHFQFPNVLTVWLMTYDSKFCLKLQLCLHSPQSIGGKWKSHMSAGLLRFWLAFLGVVIHYQVRRTTTCGFVGVVRVNSTRWAEYARFIPAQFFLLQQGQQRTEKNRCHHQKFHVFIRPTISHLIFTLLWSR